MKLNKKILLSVPIILALGFGVNRVFAKTEIKNNKNISEITKETIENKEEKEFKLFEKYDCNIKEIINFAEGVVIKTEKDNKIKEFLLDKDILLLDKKGNISKDILKVGKKISIYYINLQESTLEEPKQLKTDIIVELDEENLEETQAIHVDIFKEYQEMKNTLISLDQSLMIIPSENTEIIDKKCEKYKGDLKDKILLVQYNIATLSIPAQTTPTKIIVLDCINKEIKEKIEVKEKKEDTNLEKPVLIEQNTDKMLKEADLSQKITKAIVNGKSINIEVKYNENKIPLIPLRSIVEASDNKLMWDSKEQKIYIGGLVSFDLSKDSYVFGKRAAMSLGASPKNFDGVNYVPASLFTEFLGLNMKLENGTIIFNSNEFQNNINK